MNVGSFAKKTASPVLLRAASVVAAGTGEGQGGEQGADQGGTEGSTMSPASGASLCRWLTH